MSAENRPAHSPLGASSAERWMNCPGSVSLIKQLDLDESDEPEYRGLGIAAHEAGAHCLKNKLDAWEVMGEKFHGFEVDENMANAIQVYIDTVRPVMEKEGAISYVEHALAYAQGNNGVEEIIDPRADSILKKYFYGTGDCCIVRAADRYMDVVDYKHGEGIIVEAENNPQLLYYAFGFLLLHPEVETVRIRIVQPRTFDEPVKTWIVKATFIQDWVADKLVPAMQVTEIDGAELDAGSWCRFCPAKLVCPMMASLFGAACKSNPKEIVPLTDATLGRSYQYKDALKFYLKALEDEVYRRLNLGGVVPGCKLVPKKANRVWKPEALKVLAAKFGDEAYEPIEFKSPGSMEKLGAEAKELVREYAYTPQTGLTVATDEDKRVAVKVETTQQAFGAAVNNLKGE
jgi:Protein of unknown function (DUF2800)